MSVAESEIPANINVSADSVVNKKIRQQALWFIRLEKERVLRNFENGTADKNQTVGSLNTLYQIASYAGDVACMRNIWQAITNVRNATHALHHRFQLDIDRSHMA